MTAAAPAIIKARGAFALVPTYRRIQALAAHAEPHAEARPFFFPSPQELTGATPDTFTSAVPPEQAMLDASAALQAAAQAIMGSTLNANAVAMMLGQAMGESMFGRLVTGYGSDMAGTNNWGSVTSTSSWETAHAGQDGWGKFAHTDSIPGVRSYVAWFRLYPNQLEGAKGYLNTIMYEGPQAVLGYISQGPAAFAQYLSNHHYYTASVATYTKMLQGMQATASSMLAKANTEGLTAADPTTLTASADVIAPLNKRLTAALLANPIDVNGSTAPLPNSDGIVWFTGSPPGGSNWTAYIVPTLAGAALAGAVGLGAYEWWRDR